MGGQRQSLARARGDGLDLVASAHGQSRRNVLAGRALYQTDLMHKAVGWMLREAGALDREALRDFLSAFHKRLPRTALRYAIEHMDPEERRKWMEK